MLVLLVLVSVAQPIVAWADGPSGSTKDGKKQVKCAQGTDTPAGKLYAAPNGIESCSDDNSTPDGRVIASPDGYVVVEGDASNGDSTSGWIRVDSSGPTCSDDKHPDSTAGPGSSCG